MDRCWHGATGNRATDHHNGRDEAELEGCSAVPLPAKGRVLHPSKQNPGSLLRLPALGALLQEPPTPALGVGKPRPVASGTCCARTAREPPASCTVLVVASEAASSQVSSLEENEWPCLR